MTSVGMDWLYFTLMGLMAIFLGAFGSVFNTYSSLYIAKDNDFLLSMPIPVKIIMGSRLMSVYLIGLMYRGGRIRSGDDSLLDRSACHSLRRRLLDHRAD